MTTLSYPQLESLWIQAGGPADVASIAAAITYPESSANPAAIQPGQPYATTGWGLWQITPGNSEPQFGTDHALLDPLANAKAAVAKYRAAGNSFRPWTTYNNGAYRQYLQNVAPDASGIQTASDTGGTPPSSAGQLYQNMLGKLGPLWWTNPGFVIGAGATGAIDVGGAISQLTSDVSTGIHIFSLLFRPSFWLRVGAFFTAIILLFAGGAFLISATRNR